MRTASCIAIAVNTVRTTHLFFLGGGTCSAARDAHARARQLKEARSSQPPHRQTSLTAAYGRDVGRRAGLVIGVVSAAGGHLEHLGAGIRVALLEGWEKKK
jgi:2-polyprenyl-6-methoxyphenol hydroxylase-like FAD-dependent oxidoreductase